MNYEDQILKKLNPQQVDAVLKNDSSLRIIAGPGTGKTTTIIAKILYLILIKNVYPKSIMVFTFTNKAKEEILERLAKQLSSDQFPMIFTYHSFASYFLRIEKEALPFKEEFKIFDYSEQQQILRRLLKEEFQNCPFSVGDLLARFETFRNVVEEDFVSFSKNNKLRYEIYRRYLTKKQEYVGLDFNDLLYQTNLILEQNEEIRLKWQARFEYLFVDEFQDTNDIQLAILKQISTPQTKVVVVGDPDQNLYSWRGANINLILNFETYFPGAKTILLSQNYRSNQNILQVAKKTINYNKNRIPNDLFTKNELGEEPKVYEFNSSQEEARFLANKVATLIEQGQNPKQIAIIYRSNYISQEIESAMIAKRIKYKVIGGFKFFERKEVKETQYLIGLLILNDDFYFTSSLSVPPKGIGPKTFEKIVAHALNTNLKYYDALKDLIALKEISSQKIQAFIEVIETYRELLKSVTTLGELKTFFENFLQTIGLFTFYQEEEGRIENIKEFVNQITKELNLNALSSSLIEYLQKTSLLSASDETVKDDLITLITAHSSKGTEFDVVFVVGLSDGVFPSKNSLYKAESLEEERRSFYVALTRARNKLFLTYARGFDFSGVPRLPSRFLKEVDLSIEPSRKITSFASFKQDFRDNYKKEDYFKDNSLLSVGDVVEHNEYGQGTIIEDLDKYIRVAFDAKIGIKLLVKNHKNVKGI